ncbi:COMM domain-containing protein 8 [Ixodes scapularis]|uniref:COMM domain-containing protein 8 n=1 Tax=Ixodes scapularis TaxID=6945 RepID=UPI001A9EE6A2|nr:COMM domain-containing protein 8 [Ixodes scapularis]
MMAAPVEVDGGLCLLSKCPVERIENYLDGVADSACGLRGPSFDRYSDLWTLSEFWQSNAAWKACFESWSTSAGTPESTLGRIPASHRAAAKAVLERRSDSVLRHLLLGTVSGPFLTDFDWAVKLVLGSDRVSSLGVPLTALELCLRDQTGPRRLCLELGSAELLALVGALEAAHKAMLQLQV